MTFEEYGLWTYAREVSHESGILYFSGPGVAGRFQGEGKGAAYRIARGLVRSGWLVVLKKSKRDKKTGIYRPGEYQPLSLEEWAAKHPERYAGCGVCKAQETIPEIRNGTIPEIENGNNDTVPKIETHRSQNRNVPFLKSKRTIPEIGNKSEEENLKKRVGKRESEPGNPAPLSSPEKPNPPDRERPKLTPNGQWSVDYLDAVKKAQAKLRVSGSELELAVAGMEHTHGTDESEWPPLAQEFAQQLREGRPRVMSA
jgi:hypothetical protein